MAGCLGWLSRSSCVFRGIGWYEHYCYWWCWWYFHDHECLHGRSGGSSSFHGRLVGSRSRLVPSGRGCQSVDKIRPDDASPQNLSSPGRPRPKTTTTATTTTGGQQNTPPQRRSWSPAATHPLATTSYAQGLSGPCRRRRSLDQASSFCIFLVPGWNPFVTVKKGRGGLCVSYTIDCQGQVLLATPGFLFQR